MPDGYSAKGGFTAADFNGDGILDLAVANSNDSYSVMLGIGNRRFDPPRGYPTGAPGTTQIASGDLDNDGDIDLVVAQLDYTTNLGSVRVLVNPGHGQFLLGASYPTMFTLGVTLADTDGDGFLDIVTGNRTNNLVSVFRNAGNATFDPRVDYYSGGKAGYDTLQPRLADLDGDGALDMVTTANAGQLAVMLRRGTGYDATILPLDTNLDPSYEVADFDHDGDLDIVASYLSPAGEAGLVFLANDGTGVFTEAAPEALPARSFIIGTGDLDGDGDVDVLVRSIDNAIDSHDTVLANGGSGSFTAAWSVEEPPPDASSLTDLDGDGHLDLVSLTQETIASVAGRSDGTFAMPQEIAVTSLQAPGVRAADMDGDGKPDLVVGTEAGVEIIRNQGARSFEQPVAYPIGEPWGLAIADVDGDGRLDLVAGMHAQTAPWSVQVLLGSTAGFTTVSLPSDANPDSIAIGDLDGDGRPEIVVSCSGLDVREGTQIPASLDVFHNDGNGAFSRMTRLDGTFGTIMLADDDLDGHLDLFATATSTTQLFHGAGDGSFGAPVDRPYGIYQLVDLNHDGIADEAAHANGALTIALGLGNGTYAAPVAGPDGVIRFVDVDGDGIPDAVGFGAIGGFQLWHNNGDATFEPLGTYGGDPAGVTDIDGDGVVDNVGAGVGAVEVQYGRCAP